MPKLRTCGLPQVVGERSVLVEGDPEGLLDDTEVRMPERVARKRARNPFTESLRFPEEG